MTHAQRVNMRYHKTDGGDVTLMVGVIIPHPRFGMVCFHAFDEHNGPQEFYNEDCPCPVDSLLLRYLEEQGVTLFYGYDGDSKTLYRAKVADLLAAPARSFATKTARVRHMLPRDKWEVVKDVEILHRKGTKILTKKYSPLFSVPWCDRQHTLNPR